jgi:hypothetical protein
MKLTQALTSLRRFIDVVVFSRVSETYSRLPLPWPESQTWSPLLWASVVPSGEPPSTRQMVGTMLGIKLFAPDFSPVLVD